MQLVLKASNHAHRFRKMSRKQRSRFLGLCLLTSSLAVPVLVVRAATTDAAITPSSGAPESVVAPSQGNALITLDFARAPVSDILTMIGREGNVDVVIGEDVVGTLKSVHLTDKTADQAIRMVAQSAGVPWKKMDSRTYLVGKAALPDSSAPSTLNSGSTSDPNDVAPDAIPGSPNLGMDLVKPAPKSQDDISTTASVILRNVKPSIMAFWLDPSHQPVPADFSRSNAKAADMGEQFAKTQVTNPLAANDASKNGASNSGPAWAQPGSGYFNPYTQSHGQIGGNQGGQGGQGNQGGGTGGSSGTQDIIPSGSGTVALPQGVDNVIAIDAQNVLLVRGTDEGIDRIREIISILDRPIPQVEIEAQFVSVNKNATKQFGLSFTSTSGTNAGNGTIVTGDPTTTGINVIITRGSIQANLAAAETAGVARVLQAPRVTTFNNLAAQLVSLRTETIAVPQTTVITNTNGVPTTFTSTFFIGVNSGTILTVIPTINRDGTITIVLQPLILRSTISPVDFSSTVNSQQVNTSANIKDGDTLAIGGLRTTRFDVSKGKIPILGDLPLIGGLFRSTNKVTSEDELIVLVTAHVVRHTDDPVAGT